MIESRQNSYIKQLKKLHQKKYRNQSKLFLVEGWHLVEEAVNSEWVIKDLIIDSFQTLPPKWEQIKTTVVSSDVFKTISQTETPQGIMAVVEQKHDQQKQLHKILLVDAVQDPGNVGTIIRSALAFNVDCVILGKGTVDLYHDKVIRATQGTLFHLPVIQGDIEEWILYCQNQQIPIYGTDLNSEAKPIDLIQPSKSYALIVGNEGSGVNSDLLKQVDQTIYIPTHEKVESLNVGVATSILLYHFST